MFVIKKNHEFSWPVVLRFPSDGGKYDSYTITLKFKMLDQDVMVQEMNKEGATDLGFASSVVVGWEGVSLDGKSEADFNAENLRLFLNQPLVAAVVSTTYSEAIKGGLARKN